MSELTELMQRPMSETATANTLAILVAPSRQEALHELTGQGTIAGTGAALPFALGLHVVDFQLANLQRAGIRNVIVVQPEDAGRDLQDYLRQSWQPAFAHLACLAGPVEAEFGDFGLPVLRRCQSLIDAITPETVLVMPADQICDPDLAEMLRAHQDCGAVVTLEIHDGDDPLTRLEARLEDWLPGLHLGPTARSAGLIFQARWLRAQLDQDQGCGATLLHQILRRAFVAERMLIWTDKAKRHWRSLDSLDAFRVTWLDFLSSGMTPCRLPRDRKQLSDRQTLLSNAHDTVVMPGASVGPRASVSRAIIAPGAHVPDGLVIGQDPGFDARHFRRTRGGTVLVTKEMLSAWPQDRPL